MRDHYDFSTAIKNPYAKRLKKSITIRLDRSTVEYFKAMAVETELPYQSLINLYLKDCASKKRRLAMKWRAFRPGAA
jgi:predicted DNA binding CopG/RHH family protein